MWYREKRYEKGLPEPGDYNTTGHKVMPMGLGISCTYIFKSVSYTHLDVYKRQLLVCSLKEEQNIKRFTLKQN